MHPEQPSVDVETVEAEMDGLMQEKIEEKEEIYECDGMCDGMMELKLDKQDIIKLKEAKVALDRKTALVVYATIAMDAGIEPVPQGVGLGGPYGPMRFFGFSADFEGDQGEDPKPISVRHTLNTLYRGARFGCKSRPEHKFSMNLCLATCGAPSVKRIK